MPTPNAIGVFCGSKPGNDPAHAGAARELGRELAGRGITLVYGGGGLGMMGELATAALDAGGRVIGVIPESMVEKEEAHPGVRDMRLVETLSERKALIAGLCDAFIALPGGYGTFDELFEMVTWRQLRMHRGATGLLNVGGYFDPLIQMVDRATEAGFIVGANRGILIAERSASALVEALGAPTGCAQT